MKILLVGGNKKLNYLTKSLKASDHDVIVVNKDKQLCEIISDAYEVICVQGDGTKPSILESAGASKMDLVIALTNNDASNLVICEISKKQFNLQCTYAIVNDPKNIKFFKELGVDKCISIIQTLSELVEQESISI